MGNILVTGGTGFVGSHMIDYILKYAIRLDQKIYCTKRWMEDTKNLDHVRRKDRLKFIDCDLLCLVELVFFLRDFFFKSIFGVFFTCLLFLVDFLGDFLDGIFNEILAIF